LLWFVLSLGLLTTVILSSSPGTGNDIEEYVPVANSSDYNLDITALCATDSFTNPLDLDLTLGNFTLTRVRLLDIGWNVVVGRGLQGLSGLVAYRVFTNALMRIVENNPISYELYLSIMIRPGHWSSLWPLFKAVIRLGSFRARWTAAWLFLSLLAVLLLPTALDAVTGYVQHSSTLFTVGDGSAVSFDAFTYGNASTLQYNGTSYTLVQLIDNAICIPGDRYSWGASQSLLLIVSSTILAFVIILSAIWLDGEINSELRQKGVPMGPLRAVTELSEALYEDLGENMIMYNDKEIEKELMERDLVVRYSAFDRPGTNRAEFGLSSSMRFTKTDWNSGFKLDFDQEYTGRRHSS
jgi:hypothetical protein